MGRALAEVEILNNVIGCCKAIYVDMKLIAFSQFYQGAGDGQDSVSHSFRDGLINKIHK